MSIEELLKHRRVVQFMEYAVGGGLYFVVGYAIFAISYSGFGWAWWVGKILGDVLGLFLNFLVQRYWAFNSKILYQREWLARVRYGILMVFNISLDYLMTAILIDKLGVEPYLALLIAATFFTVWNYVCYRFWVFTGHKHSDEELGV